MVFPCLSKDDTTDVDAIAQVGADDREEGGWPMMDEEEAMRGRVCVVTMLSVDKPCDDSDTPPGAPVEREIWYTCDLLCADRLLVFVMAMFSLLTEREGTLVDDRVLDDDDSGHDVDDDERSAEETLTSFFFELEDDGGIGVL